MEYPLYPKLTEEGKKEAQNLLDNFVINLRSAADEALRTLHCDIIPYIESNSWQNFRNEMMAGFKNYGNRKIQGKFDFKDIRAQIYRDFRDEIVKDLNLDLLSEIKVLKEQLEFERSRRGDGCY